MRLGAFSQPMALHGSSTVKLSMDSVKSDGSTESIMIDSCASLPDAENFSVRNLIDAKIPVQSVNTKVVGSADFNEYVNFINNSNSIGENNNEDQ